MKKRTGTAVGAGAAALVLAGLLAGCQSSKDDVVTIEMVQYKPEAVDVIEGIETNVDLTILQRRCPSAR